MANESDKNGAGPAGKAEPSLADMQRTTDDIGRMIHELRATQSAIRSQMLVTSLVIVMIMLVFGVVLFNRMRENLRADKLQNAAMEKSKMLIPVLESQLKGTLYEVLPEYREEAKKRMQHLSPKLQASLKVEGEKFTANLQAQLNQEIERRFNQSTDHAEKALAREFPTLMNDNGGKISGQIKDAVRSQGELLQNHVKSLFEAESAKVGKTLAKFPVPDVSQTEADMLERRFIHSLVMLADYEILAAGPPPSLDTARVGTPITPH